MEIRLQNGPCTAIADTRGGELTRFSDGSGAQYIWEGDPAYWSGRNPNLFPIVGNLKDGRVRFYGREYQMARHGFARGSEFSVAEQGKDFVAFELRESPETLACYPFPFRFQVRHQLLPDGFSTTFRVQNPGDAPLPFCVGAHTAFRCPMHQGERFQDYQLVFDQPEDAVPLPLTPEGLLSPNPGAPIPWQGSAIPLDYQFFDQRDTLVFEGLRSQAVRLVHRDTGHGVRMDFPGFPMIAFWTKPHASAPYICLEPWHGCAARADETGEFTDKPHCVTLQPGEERELAYTVRVI